MSSNLSVSWTPHHEETLIGGLLQGRKMFDPRGASKVCKKGMWKLAAEIAGAVGMKVVVMDGSYRAMKEGEVLRDRRKLKQEVRGVLMKGEEWVKNDGGEEFEIGD